MKTLMMVLVLLLCYGAEASAQTNNVFWVVETNVRHPNYTIVHFYNSRNVKVHEVRLQGVYLDITNPKHRRKLDVLMKQFNDRTVASSKRKRAKSAI
jgi:hypothetical protein